MSEVDFKSILKERVDQAYLAMDRTMRESLYSDDHAERKKKTWSWYWHEAKWRINGAWLVLIGKADIS